VYAKVSRTAPHTPLPTRLEDPLLILLFLQRACLQAALQWDRGQNGRILFVLCAKRVNGGAPIHTHTRTRSGDSTMMDVARPCRRQVNRSIIRIVRHRNTVLTLCTAHNIYLTCTTRTLCTTVYTRVRRLRSDRISVIGRLAEWAHTTSCRRIVAPAACVGR